MEKPSRISTAAETDRRAKQVASCSRQTMDFQRVSNIRFKDFPASYRYAQGGMALLGLLPLVIHPFFKPNVPRAIQIFTIACLVGLGVFSLVLSGYTVVRYPYLSLVQPADGDHYDKHFSSSGTWIFNILKYLALIVVVVMILSLFVGGVNNLAKSVLLLYMLVMLGFLIFLTFYYDPLDHPTIATFARATLGVGVVLFPLFIPVLVIGSLRCSRLLDEMSSSEGLSGIE